MQSRLCFSITLIILLAIGTYPVTAFALTVSNPSITIDCTQVCIGAGTTVSTDRDNLGTGQESNGFSVEDGIGTHLAGDGEVLPLAIHTHILPLSVTHTILPLSIIPLFSDLLVQLVMAILFRLPIPLRELAMVYPLHRFQR